MDPMNDNADAGPPPDFPEGPDLKNEAWPAKLNEKHRLYLYDRGVSPEVAAARGYVSVETRSSVNEPDLGNYGWGKNHEIRQHINQAKGLAALIIPLYDATRSEPSTHQARLDSPRVSRENKAIKFEAPHGVERGPEHGNIPADVNPLRHQDATDTDAPLIITEGIPKADALLTAAIAEGIDLVPVALTGVTMGYEVVDPTDGSMTVSHALTPSLARIVEGRETVYLCWDSDWAEKKMVRGSLVRTGQLLAEAGVENVIYLGVPNADKTDKTGVDDWLAAGGRLSDLLANCQMEAPSTDEPEEEQLAGQQVRNIFEVDEARRTIWAWEMRRIGSDPKPKPVQEMKLDAVAKIIDVVSDCRIVDHVLQPETETFTVRVDWFKPGPGGSQIPMTRDIEVLATEFNDVRTWLSSLAATARIELAPTRNDHSIVANTIVRRSNLASADQHNADTSVIVSTTGWYFEPGLDDGVRPGWRYIHGHGWIGSPTEIKLGEGGDKGLGGITVLEPSTGADSAVSSTSEARFCHPLLDTDLPKIVDSWRQWFDDWVLGGVVDRLIAEDPKRFGPKNDEDREYLADLKLRLAFGALVIARSLLPGAPAMGTPYLVGAPSAGKTKIARVWTSAFGERFGERPYLSFSSTSAGVEVKLAAARNMVALVDDFHPSTIREMEVMTKVIDQIARGAYDGAVKSRSTRDLKAMDVPQISGSVLLTGEELPSQTSASNSTIQRLIVLPIRHGSSPAYEMMTHISEEDTEPQRRAVGYMIGVLARRLDLAVDPGDSSPLSKASASATKVVEGLTEFQTLLNDTTIERTSTRASARPSDRTKTVIKDLLLGGALIMEIAREIGAIESPAKFEKVVTALTNASRWALTETARIVAETSPTSNTADMIVAAISSGRGHLVTADGIAPPDDSAITWGWNRRPDGAWEKSGERLGFVVTVNGEPVVALNPMTTSKALRGMADDKEYTHTRLRASLAGAMGPDGLPALVPGYRKDDPRRTISINGQRQKCLVLRPKALGLDVSKLAEVEPGSAKSFFTADEQAVGLHDVVDDTGTGTGSGTGSDGSKVA